MCINKFEKLYIFVLTLTLNQEIYEIPDKKLQDIYTLICQIKDNLYKIDLDRIDNGMEQVKEKFLEVFNPCKDGGNNGDN